MITPRVLDLFSGIGAFSLGLERAGMRAIRFCEINTFCRRVLARHWPDVPCHDDVTTMQFSEGEADVICGGFPCQDMSLAGKRAGLAGARSGLYRELVRAIRVVRPRVAILENVAALLSDGMGTVLGDLAEIGANAEWDCVPACTIGAPHERDRVWIVAHADSVDVDGRGYDASADAADLARERCRQRWSRRPPDSFARVRDEARRNAADPYGARLAFREGLGRDAWEKLTPVERGAFQNGEQQIWPDEPALSGVDDGDAYWMDRVAATGNQVVPQIPELIGRSIMEACAA
jgi:DNA (cytosine-5)-methyltransferase 1